MTTFSHLLELLGTIPDPRRAQGKLYALPPLLLFAILAVVAGANSYRGIHSLIDVHLDRLKAAFGLRWRRAPAYTPGTGLYVDPVGLAGPRCGGGGTGLPYPRRRPGRSGPLRGRSGRRLRRQDAARELRSLRRPRRRPSGERLRGDRRSGPRPH